jgi:hypothetical protein
MVGECCPKWLVERLWIETADCLSAEEIVTSNPRRPDLDVRLHTTLPDFRGPSISLY